MINKVILIGNLGADPEIRYTQNGAAVASFTVATTEKWKGQDGQMQESTEWHRIIAWQRLAEICGEYLSKGSKVDIEG
jgi:single-strand DNA-binding protein